MYQVGKNKENQHLKHNTMTTITYWVITINVNGLNLPIRRQKLAEMMTNQHPTVCYLQKSHLT